MKNLTLNVRRVYNVNGLVFNVGENGSMTRFDNVFKKRYGYASADNIKHCLTEKFCEITNLERPKRYYAKNIKKEGDKDKQADVFTDFDLRNPFIRLNGVWNPNEISFNDEKYNKCAMKSIINFSDMLPLHVLLTNMDKQCGVNCGNASDAVYFKEGKNDNVKMFFTVEELVKNGGKTQKDAEQMFRETRPMNFYEKNETSSGIYYIDRHINLTNLIYVDVTNVTLTEEDEMEYIKDGYKFEIINGKKYFIVPKEQALSDLQSIIEAMFTWDFLSNNSVHGSVKEPLRTTISLNNTELWQQSTMASLNEDGKSVSLDFNSAEEDEECGVYSFNTKLLKKFYNNTNIEYSSLADKKAMEKIMEIAVNSVEKL